MDELSFPISRTEAGLLLGLLRRGIKSKKHNKAKSTFVPEPGKRDVALFHIEVLEELQKKLEGIMRPKNG